jgi:hypothetical protein
MLPLPKIFFMMLAVALFAAGCTPEQIGQAQDQAAYQLTDPGSQVQQAAETVGTVVNAAKPFIGLLPGGNYVLIAITAISAVCNLLQRLRSSKQQLAIKELVKAGEQFKDSAPVDAQQLFKQSQAAAQSQTTKEIVAIERVKGG